jgi:hypothetical protein
MLSHRRLMGPAPAPLMASWSPTMEASSRPATGTTGTTGSHESPPPVPFFPAIGPNSKITATASGTGTPSQGSPIMSCANAGALPTQAPSSSLPIPPTSRYCFSGELQPSAGTNAFLQPPKRPSPTVFRRGGHKLPGGVSTLRNNAVGPVTFDELFERVCVFEEQHLTIESILLAEYRAQRNDAALHTSNVAMNVECVLLQARQKAAGLPQPSVYLSMVCCDMLDQLCRSNLFGGLSLAMDWIQLHLWQALFVICPAQITGRTNMVWHFLCVCMCQCLR